jgi:SNF2 family DNA or RNA helicase
MFFYEEFMARSSTRQALQKGGNYMGMMNVLMQLRKVCNHPDLFEPRSVVTPFVLDNVTITVPDCIVGADENGNVFGRLSQRIVSPLWCGSGASPSVTASTEHDAIRSTLLKDLEDNLLRSDGETQKLQVENDTEKDLSPALSRLLQELDETSNCQRNSKIEFQRKINAQRCRSPAFPLSSRLVRAIKVPDHPIYHEEVDLLSCPSQLLAIRRSQQDRANELDEMIKNFVFCVPKAGARRPVLDARQTGKHTKLLEDMLLEPLEEYLVPFRKAHARLTSFFPDKKLVQFDAGKLQTLAELLHDLKRGGHRVLIFTQMSKMLDILEAFLNLNGHTYVRLDGSTGVDRRQRLMDRFNNDPKIFSFILSTRSGGMGINLTGESF